MKKKKKKNNGRQLQEWQVQKQPCRQLRQREGSGNSVSCFAPFIKVRRLTGPRKEDLNKAKGVAYQALKSKAYLYPIKVRPSTKSTFVATHHG